MDAHSGKPWSEMEMTVSAARALCSTCRSTERVPACGRAAGSAIRIFALNHTLKVPGPSLVTLRENESRMSGSGRIGRPVPWRSTTPRAAHRGTTPNISGPIKSDT
jgi:hypothetical protein